MFDAFILQRDKGESATVPVAEILRKLDTDFFSARWTKITGRQRELLSIVSALENSDDEFTVQEIVETSQQLTPRPFGGSQVNQMLSALAAQGLVFKTRHGRYSFAVPLFADYMRRQHPVWSH